MPLFEYQCEKCDYRFDKMVPRWDAEVKCPSCQGKVDKLMSTFAVGNAQKTPLDLPQPPGPKMCTSC